MKHTTNASCLVCLTASVVPLGPPFWCAASSRQGIERWAWLGSNGVVLMKVDDRLLWDCHLQTPDLSTVYLKSLCADLWALSISIRLPVVIFGFVLFLSMANAPSHGSINNDSLEPTEFQIQ